MPISVPFFGAFVVFLDDAKQMLCVFFADVFDAKIIYYESEFDWAPFMMP